MIDDVLARLDEIEWSAINSPADVDRLLQAKEMVVRRLRPRSDVFKKGRMDLWLLVGSNRETGERLMFEFTCGPFITDPHGYPQNGHDYGQRVWVLSGELHFICTGATKPIVVLRPGQQCDHPSGIWHRTFVPQQAVLLIHQPHGSVLHPCLPARSARLSS